MPETQHARNKSGKYIYQCTNDSCREELVFGEIQPTAVAICCPNCISPLRPKPEPLINTLPEPLINTLPDTKEDFKHAIKTVFSNHNSRISKNSPDGMGRDYYASPGGIECIEVIESLELTEGFCIGNAFKYMFRAGKKGGDNERLEDLKKARWYLDRLISHLTDHLPAPKISEQSE